tara:strand:- start:437 stop:661 length:225 start_codon:yes stop_codon:yes gene_type:complete
MNTPTTNHENGDYFIDIRVAGLDNLFMFIKVQEHQLARRGIVFKYEILLPKFEHNVFIVRHWVNPLDYFKQHHG